MQLTLNYGSTPVALANYAGGDVVSEWALDQERAVQVSEALRALNVKARDRGNARHTLAFANKRPPFASPLLAAEFTVEHLLAIAAEAGVTDITFKLGASQQYKLHDAVITRTRPALQGTTVTTSYEIVGGLLEKL